MLLLRRAIWPFAQTAEVSCEKDEDCTKETTGWDNARCIGTRCVEIPGESQQLPTGPGRAQDVLETLDTITDWVFAIAMTIALIFLIMAAFQFVTGGVDPAKIGEARQKLMYAFIGIAVAFVSAGFVRVIAAIVT